MTGLSYGGRDRANWKADIAADLERMRNVSERGWEYHLLWMFMWRQEHTLLDERLREVEGVDREERRTPGLPESLVYGCLAPKMIMSSAFASHWSVCWEPTMAGPAAAE